MQRLTRDLPNAGGLALPAATLPEPATVTFCPGSSVLVNSRVTFTVLLWFATYVKRLSTEASAVFLTLHCMMRVLKERTSESDAVSGLAAGVHPVS